MAKAPDFIDLGPRPALFLASENARVEATVRAGSTKYYLWGAVWVAQGRTSPQMLLRFTGLPWLAA
jgi:hypothetical protein